MGVYGAPRQGGGRRRQPGRVLRRRGSQLRARRRGTTGRPTRVGRRTPGGALMSYQTMAPPPATSAPVATKVKPSGWWHVLGALLIVAGVGGAIALIAV